MTDFLRPEVAEQAGYEPDHTTAEVILDANESPYDLPEAIKEASHRRLRQQAYNRYPDPDAEALVDEAAAYFGVDSSRIVAGNGSDELITYLLTACLRSGDRVVVPRPTFSMYGLLARQLRAEVTSVPLEEDWSLNETIVDAARDSRVVFLGMPNNPTGNCFSADVIERVLETTSTVVVVDEAYHEFSHVTWMDRLDEYPQLVVLRTLSKAFGLAGIRVGFLVGSAELVGGVRTVKLPYNLNRLSQVTAQEALKARDRILERVDIIRRERQRLETFLSDRGLRPSPSDANFVLFQPPDPEALHRHLLESGIRIRAFSEPELSPYLRVTVGTPEQNERFMSAVDAS